MGEKTYGKFTVDMAYFDLDAIVELSGSQGMMFDTARERDEFFRRVAIEPRSVPYGTALSHARATNLGIWGSDEMLYRDCVRLMAAELRRLETETDRLFDISEEEIARSGVFSSAYEIARRPKRAAINNLVRSLGTNHQRLPFQTVENDQTFNALTGLHQRLIDELRGKDYQGDKQKPYW